MSGAIHATEANPRDGGCNFCTRALTGGMMVKIESGDDNRHLSVRLCRDCAEELRKRLGVLLGDET